MDYEGYIKAILNWFRKTGLYIDIKKSEFSVIYTKFLDFIINIEGIIVDLEKIDTICQ